MPKPNNKRTRIAVYFVPGKEPTQITGTGTILQEFKDHCDRNGFQYSRKVIELCQDALENYSHGEELKARVRKAGVDDFGLKIGDYIRWAIAMYMNELKAKEKWTKGK